jgi:hypothetical protein
VQGVIEGLNRILDIAIPENSGEGGTLPGRGRLSDEADVVEYRNMVVIVRDRIQDLMKKGMTLAQVRAARPTLDYDFRYGTRVPDYLKRRLSRPVIQSEIHGDTLDEARRGSNLTKEFALTEKGELVNGIGDPMPTRHDILTGSQPDGRAFADAADRT